MDDMKVAELVFVEDQLQADFDEAMASSAPVKDYGVEPMAWLIGMVRRRHDLYRELLTDAQRD
jgi:hypothetical protein